MKNRILIVLIFLLPIFLGTYAIVSNRADIIGMWPPGSFRKLVRIVTHDPVQYDQYERLSEFPGKQEVACPVQTAKTAVFLIMGQSNAANYQGQRYQAIDSRVINFHDGHCYIAKSPLLGASGELGESWTLLGNELTSKEMFDSVVMIPVGVAGTAIHQWAPNGNLSPMLEAVVKQAQPRFTITHVLWHQGETDYLDGTSERAYISDFHAMSAHLRKLSVSAPIYICRASFVPDTKSRELGLRPAWSNDNAIVRAQNSLIAEGQGHPGPDTDAQVSEMDRYDGLHFSASGQQRFVDSWVRYLRPDSQKLTEK